MNRTVPAGVAVENFSVCFFQQRVLDRVNAVFPAGELSVLVGRSGSGKTTLLRAVNRLNEEFPGCVSTGQIRVSFAEGERPLYPASVPGALADAAAPAACSTASPAACAASVDASPVACAAAAVGASPAACAAPANLLPPLPLGELRRRVGMLFQTPNLFPTSIRRNLLLPLTLAAGHSKREAEQRAEESLAAVGLWEELRGRLDLPAERLSGGQQQRLCLARTLALEPEVLLLDEPTASLDVHASREIEKLLLGLAGRYTVILVSHSLAQARRLGSRILICENGRLTGSLSSSDNLSEEALAALL